MFCHFELRVDCWLIIWPISFCILKFCPQISHWKLLTDASEATRWPNLFTSETFVNHQVSELIMKSKKITLYEWKYKSITAKQFKIFSPLPPPPSQHNRSAHQDICSKFSLCGLFCGLPKHLAGGPGALCYCATNSAYTRGRNTNNSKTKFEIRLCINYTNCAIKDETLVVFGPIQVNSHCTLGDLHNLHLCL